MFTLDELKEQLLSMKDKDGKDIWGLVAIPDDNRLAYQGLEDDCDITLMKYVTPDREYLMWIRLVNSIFSVENEFTVDMQQLVVSTVCTFSEKSISILESLSQEEVDKFFKEIHDTTKYNFLVNNGLLTIVHSTMLPQSDEIMPEYLRVYPYCVVAHVHTVYKYIEDRLIETFANLTVEEQTQTE